MASSRRKAEEVVASFSPAGLTFVVTQRSNAGDEPITLTSTSHIWAKRRNIIAALAALGFKKGPAPKA